MAMDKPAPFSQACLIQLIAPKLLPVDGSRDKIRAYDQTKCSSFPDRNSSLNAEYP